MRMDEIGYNHKHDKSFVIDRPEGVGDWLMLAVKTKSIFVIDGAETHAPSGSFIIYTPDFPQYYQADNTEYVDDWIHFGPDPEEEILMKKLGIPLNQIVSVADITGISAIIRDMCYEHYSANPNRKAVVDLYFRLMLYKINESMSVAKLGSVSENMYFEKLLWIRESIYRWPARNWSIDDMAAELSLSRSRFQHLYSQTFGVSVSKDIITSRLDHAVDMLEKSDLSVNDIALAVGYSNSSYFIRQFRSVFDTTPVQYRADYWENHKRDYTGEV
ncbi:MAG: helix-turn-helix transcriptional regulator [Ruminococcus sp.]|nr:helix-turn-helix transcriptional regulator [Ruminococcus sp.]